MLFFFDFLQFLGPRGGRASIRLDHGSKPCRDLCRERSFLGGCTSGQLDSAEEWELIIWPLAWPKLLTLAFDMLLLSNLVRDACRSAPVDLQASRTKFSKLWAFVSTESAGAVGPIENSQKAAVMLGEKVSVPMSPAVGPMKTSRRLLGCWARRLAYLRAQLWAP